jgi:hypothetical protein
MATAAVSDRKVLGPKLTVSVLFGGFPGDTPPSCELVFNVPFPHAWDGPFRDERNNGRDPKLRGLLDHPFKPLRLNEGLCECDVKQRRRLLRMRRHLHDHFARSAVREATAIAMALPIETLDGIPNTCPHHAQQMMNFLPIAEPDTSLLNGLR